MGEAHAPSNQVPWPPGTEVQAQYSFKGNSSEDLPFNRKDILHIVQSTRDPMWYRAKNREGMEGMIPANYVIRRGEVKLNSMPWFHGLIQRQKAEDLLANHKDGDFLVRESTNYRGDYTLCVACDGKVEHYHIINRNNQLTIDEDVYFDSLGELVAHYEADADGLCTKLQHPVEKKGQQVYHVDRSQFIQQGWVIKLKNLELNEVIGHGDFGDVRKGKYNGQAVAIKCLKDSSTAEQFLAEASVMTTLRHPNLVQLIGIVLGDEILIVTEYMARGALVDYLRSRGRTVISNDNQIHFASDTCCGMKYLEEKRLVHRDLAARNVLIAEDGSAKVADFGLAKPIETASASTGGAPGGGGKFPIKWTAPESLREAQFTSKSDMWSFGILLWEIYSFGRVPYPRIPLAEVVAHVERGYRMEAPDGCPREVYDIMLSAWNINPKLRPTFAEVMVQLNTIRQQTTASAP